MIDKNNMPFSQHDSNIKYNKNYLLLALFFLLPFLMPLAYAKTPLLTPSEFNGNELPKPILDAIKKTGLPKNAFSIIIEPVLDKKALQQLKQKQEIKQLEQQLKQKKLELNKPQKKSHQSIESKTQPESENQSTKNNQPTKSNQSIKNQSTKNNQSANAQTEKPKAKLNTKKPKNQKKVTKPSLPYPYVSFLANQPRLPASTLKIATTYAGLDALGKGFRWYTKVYHTGTIKNNTLMGDLIIKGSGDPKLVKENIKQLMQNIQAKGVKHIQGNLYLDDGLFQGIQHNPASFDGKALRPYNAGANALLTNFSTLVLSFEPLKGVDYAKITLAPQMAGLHVPLGIKTSDARCQRRWQKQLKAMVSNFHISFEGAYPKRCGKSSWSFVPPDARLFIKQVFVGEWLAAGGSLSGHAFFMNDKATKPTAQKKRLTSIASADLASIIKDINHYSNNVMTEQLYLSLPVYSKKTYGVRRYASYKNSGRWFKRWWRKNIRTSQATGKKTTPAPKISRAASGLCRKCDTTANSLNALLQTAAQRKHFIAFKQSLGVAGKSGTIFKYKYRKPSSPAIGNAYIKTGTINRVASIAGYVDGKSGQRYSVVAIINHAKATSARSVLDEVMHWTAKQ